MDIKELAVKNTKKYITDDEREMLRNAGYTFNIKRGANFDYAEILQHGRKVAVVINGKVKWL